MRLSPGSCHVSFDRGRSSLNLASSSCGGSARNKPCHASQHLAHLDESLCIPYHFAGYPSDMSYGPFFHPSKRYHSDAQQSLPDCAVPLPSFQMIKLVIHYEGLVLRVPAPEIDGDVRRSDDRQGYGKGSYETRWLPTRSASCRPQDVVFPVSGLSDRPQEARTRLHLDGWLMNNEVVKAEANGMFIQEVVRTL
jgi:hypothetical protein